MTSDADTIEALEAKEAFYAYIATVPVDIRDAVADMAYGNSWCDGCRDEYESDEEAWVVAKSCAEMIVGAPVDYGI